MKRNPDATCGNCPYHEVETEADIESREVWEHGVCRKRSPMQLVLNSVLNLTWASVQRDDWCGEHPDFEMKECCVDCWGKSVERCDRCGKVVSATTTMKVKMDAPNA